MTNNIFDLHKAVLITLNRMVQLFAEIDDNPFIQMLLGFFKSSEECRKELEEVLFKK